MHNQCSSNGIWHSENTSKSRSFQDDIPGWSFGSSAVGRVTMRGNNDGGLSFEFQYLAHGNVIEKVFRAVRISRFLRKTAWISFLQKSFFPKQQQQTVTFSTATFPDAMHYSLKHLPTLHLLMLQFGGVFFVFREYLKELHLMQHSLRDYSRLPNAVVKIHFLSILRPTF